MIDSDIIDGRLMGIIEPGSRAELVLKTTANIILLRKLSVQPGEPVGIPDSEFKSYLRDNEVRVTGGELEVLKRYYLLETKYYQENYNDYMARYYAGDKSRQRAYHIWNLGEVALKTLQILKEGDEAYLF